MAEIRFLPVCSNCNNIIYETIDFGAPDPTYFEDYRKYFIPISRISPNICPYCGEYFNRILMPTELPFELNKYDKRISKFGEEYDR